MISPIVKTIEVPCSQRVAFTVFVHEMDTWWPLAKYTTSAMTGQPAKAIRVEPRVGGDIVEVGPDDTEHLWGTIMSYQPHDFVSMNFHIPQPGEVVVGRSLVEVRFTPLDESKTRVELTQSNWEAFGEIAADLRGGYGGGWIAIFEQAYKEACSSGRD